MIVSQEKNNEKKQVRKCPICHKNELEDNQFVCSECEFEEVE
jgi:acetyl-CoA carboxylase beta subunit